MHRFVACAPGSRRSSAPGNGATVCVECDGEASPKPPPKCISPPPPTTSSALSTFSRRKHELRPASDDHRRTAHTKRRHATPIFIPRTGLLIPAALDFDLCPWPRSNGSNLPRHAHQLVPCVTTCVHDGVVVCPYALAEKVGPKKLPHILDGIKFRRIARKQEQADVVGDTQFRRGVPTRTVQHEHRIRARRNPPAHVGQMCLHRLGVHFRHHDGGADATIRADRAEDIGRGVTPISWSTRARPPLCADANLRNGVTSFLNNQPNFNIRTTSIYTVLKHPESFKDIADGHRGAVVDRL